VNKKFSGLNAKKILIKNLILLNGLLNLTPFSKKKESLFWEEAGLNGQTIHLLKKMKIPFSSQKHNMLSKTVQKKSLNEKKKKKKKLN
jgi:hypothetical protein